MNIDSSLPKVARWKSVCAVVASLVALVVAGCGPRTPAAKTDTAVKTDVPKKKPLRRVIEQPATIEGFQEAPLVAYVNGYVESVLVDIGQEIVGPKVDAKKPGTLLAELSVPELIKEHAQKAALVKQMHAEVEQAKADYAASVAHIQTAQAMVREAKAAIAKADANADRWESEYQRVDELYRNKVVERQILDETLNQLKAARAVRQEVAAKVDSAQAIAKESEAKRDKTKADGVAAQARVEVAQAAEARLKTLVDYRFIYAPFDGVVTRRYVQVGNYLQPNASGGAAVLFHVARTDKLRIIADIPETDAQYIADKLKAKIQIPALVGESIDGEVARTSRTLDPKTRTLRVEIDHLNKDKKLRPGMFANVVFTVNLGERTTLPATAIFNYADAPCCWRIVDGKAVRTPLKLGVRDGQDVEVLQMKKDSAWANVAGDEEIVVSNLGAVSEGKEVRK